jgi:uncharacterized cupredoxin-like copper-binding protein
MSAGPGVRDRADRVATGGRSQPLVASAGAWRRAGGLIAAAAVVGGAVTAIAYGVAGLRSGEQAAAALGPGNVTVELHIDHSLFDTTEIRVVEGTRVRFVVDNRDPINHEFIVGGPEVHARHANGKEARHPSIPGEVSVGANELGVTTFRFDDPGSFEFACHLPGHYQYGMHGVVEVIAATDS